MKTATNAFFRRLLCILTFNHIDPGVKCVEQQFIACKKCNKVWRAWE